MKRIKYYFNVAFISAVRWLYNHSMLFNKFLRSRARKQSPLQEILLDVLLTDKPIDVDKVCNDIRNAR